MTWRTWCVVAVVAGALGLPSVVRAQTEVAATLSVLAAPVERIPAGASAPEPGVNGMNLADGDRIKTGVGGLVDAEFIAQTLCLAHSWHEPNTMRALLLARNQNALPGAEADSLIENYRQLLRIESILRRWSFAGEAVLPDDPAALYRVAVRCGFPDAESCMKAVGEWRAAIRGVYANVMG